jgi:hypothetical protein
MRETYSPETKRQARPDAAARLKLPKQSGATRDSSDAVAYTALPLSRATTARRWRARW